MASLFPRLASSRKSPRFLRLETLEDRLAPAATFDPASGALFLQADKPSGNDTVRVQAAGAAADGSTGVKVTSALVKGGTQTFGDAAHPVTLISLDLKNGNDTVQIGDLKAVTVRIGEGDGNNSVTVGKTAASVFIAGAGLNRVTLGDATRDLLYVVDPEFGNNLYVAIGYSYGFDASGGFGITDHDEPLASNAKANVVRLLDSSAGVNYVEINGTGSNTVTTGDGHDGVSVFGFAGSGNNSITVGDGDNSYAQVASQGRNSIKLGNGAGDAAYVNGTGNNTILLGDGDGDFVRIFGGSGIKYGTGNNTIRLGHGDGDSVQIRYANGNNSVTAGDGDGDVVLLYGGASNRVQLGDGDGDRVLVLANVPGGKNGTGDNFIRLGDGDGDSVDVRYSNGNNTVLVGDGSDVSVSHDYFYFAGKPGTGNNVIRVGNGDRAQVKAGGVGNNAITVGDGDGDGIAFDGGTSSVLDKTYTPGKGNNTFVMGNGNGDTLQLANAEGNNVIRVGNGDGDSVLVYAVHDAAWNGDPASAAHVSFVGAVTIRMGDGSGDRVVVDKNLGDTSATLGNGDDLWVVIDGAGGTGKNVVRAGDGANVSVTLRGDGALEAVVGRGSGASIDLNGAGTHKIDARNNTGAKIRNSGLGGGYIAAALGSDLISNGLVITMNANLGGLSVRLF